MEPDVFDAESKVSICGNSIAVADINGSSAYSFNTSGQVGKADTSMPILQIEVSDSGKDGDGP